jgi:hypothetical protein
LLSPTSEPTTAAAEPTKAPRAPAAKPTATAESVATAAKSTTTAAAIEAAALKALEPLARKITTRPVLSLAVQITGSASTPGPIETASP